MNSSDVFAHCGRILHKKLFSLRLGEFAIVLLQEWGSWITWVHEFKWFQAVSRSNPFLQVMILDSRDQQGSMIILNTQKITPRSLPIHSLVKGFWHKSIVLANALLSSANYNETGRMRMRGFMMCTKHIIGFQDVVKSKRSGTAHYNISSPSDNNVYHSSYVRTKNQQMMTLVLPGKPTSQSPPRMFHVFIGWRQTP